VTAPAIPRQPDAAADDREHVARLVAAAKAGSADAFGQLYDLYVNDLYLFAYRRCRDQHLAEDITADTFVRALKGMAAFEPRAGGFQGWLYTIARNLVHDHFKSARYRTQALFAVVEEFVPEQRNDAFAANGFLPDNKHQFVNPGSTCADPAVLTDAYLRSRDLLSIVRDSLSGEQRDVLLNRFWRGLSLTETAQAMGKNEGAIKALQYRATNAIRRHLAAAGHASGATL
jgi:RNA polymerase sigma-70 factor (ECF subfamily)